MSVFKKTTHLSEIIEASDKQTVTIFIHSNNCNASSRIEEQIENEIDRSAAKPTVFMVTVQTEPVLSSKIEEWFDIKHESPQIITISKGKVLYTAHHDNINLAEFIGK